MNQSDRFRGAVFRFSADKTFRIFNQSAVIFPRKSIGTSKATVNRVHWIERMFCMRRSLIGSMNWVQRRCRPLWPLTVSHTKRIIISSSSTNTRNPTRGGYHPWHTLGDTHARCRQQSRVHVPIESRSNRWRACWRLFLFDDDDSYVVAIPLSNLPAM